MPDVLSALKQHDASANQAAAEKYRNLVEQLVRGSDDPALADVQDTLAAAGKSTEDLSNAVFNAKRRQRKLDELLAAKVAAGEVDGLRAKIVEANQVLEQARDSHQATVWPLKVRIDEINQLLLSTVMIESELIRSCTNQTLLSREARNRDAMVATGIEINRTSDSLERLQTSLSCARAAADVAAYTERISRLTNSLTELRTRAAALLAESKEITRAMIEA